MTLKTIENTLRKIKNNRITKFINKINFPKIKKL